MTRPEAKLPQAGALPVFQISVGNSRFGFPIRNSKLTENRFDQRQNPQANQFNDRRPVLVAKGGNDNNSDNDGNDSDDNDRKSDSNDENNENNNEDGDNNEEDVDNNDEYVNNMDEGVDNMYEDVDNMDGYYGGNDGNGGDEEMYTNDNDYDPHMGKWLPNLNYI